MEFRLTYEGELLATQSDDLEKQSRLKNKQKIRHWFHNQLSELYEQDSRLKPLKQAIPYAESDGSTTYRSDFEALAKINQVRGIGWIPLVDGRYGAACSLSILFLRHEPRGGIVQSGDLDNRIKTLFDALRPPKDNEFPDHFDPLKEPNPFLCLMSDDQLITDFRVIADRWLMPKKGPTDADVSLVIEVRTFIADHEKAAFYRTAVIHR